MPTERQPDDGLLMRYLLGSLPEAENERLDEMSIRDDDVAWQLRAVENDLVDSYVRGGMSGETLERFRTSYLSSPERRQKVQIARALVAGEGREVPIVAARTFPVRWAVAASVAVLMIATAWLSVVQRSRDVQIQPDEVSATIAPAQPPRVVQTVSFLLSSPTRGGGAITSLEIPRGTENVTLRLQLDADDFAGYRGELRDLGRDEIIWRSSDVAALSDGPRQIVSFDIPAAILSQQNYSMELSGVTPDRKVELIASYPFRAALRAT